MMDDWKRRVDKYLEDKQRTEQQRQADMRQHQSKKDEQHRKNLEAEYNKRLREHQRKFRCYICGKPSEGPKRLVHVFLAGGGERWDERDRFVGEDVFSKHHLGSDIFRAAWDKPFGLVKCRSCSKWACEDHIYQGRCQYCWDKVTK